jgi:hypothetical protein
VNKLRVEADSRPIALPHCHDSILKLGEYVNTGSVGADYWSPDKHSPDGRLTCIGHRQVSLKGIYLAPKGIPVNIHVDQTKVLIPHQDHPGAGAEYRLT